LLCRLFHRLFPLRR
ncbi:hypothetical protein Hypma_000184, partial [Hypsizygus marmoreus]